MIENEFRGKRIDTDEWVYGCLTRYSENVSSITVNFVVNVVYTVSTKSVGQFTGFLDKNRKKIYKGDIVMGEIVSYLEYDAVVTKKITRKNLLHNRILSSFKIIGNAHDNPELLEEK